MLLLYWSSTVVSIPNHFFYFPIRIHIVVSFMFTPPARTYVFIYRLCLSFKYKKTAPVCFKRLQQLFFCFIFQLHTGLFDHSIRLCLFPFSPADFFYLLIILHLPICPNFSGKPLSDFLMHFSEAQIRI